MCGNLYCQQCLQPCVQDEVIHDHKRTCWSKFQGLIDIMKDWGETADQGNNIPKSLLTKACFVFIFGNHVLYTKKFFDFF